MNLKKILLVFLIFAIICSVNTLSANELSENNHMNSNFNEPILNNDISQNSGSIDFISEDNIISSENLQNNNSNDYTIYVGPNTENGNGSEENPFSSFELACNDVKDGKENVTVNVFDGEYKLGSRLQFNVTNLHINGLGQNVIIKGDLSTQESFKIATSGFFTMSNITVKVDNPSGNTNSNQNPDGTKNYFLIFEGPASLATFNDCNFDVGNLISSYNTCQEYQFNRCLFISGISAASFRSYTKILFKNSIVISEDSFTKQMSKFKSNVTFDDCYFGDLSSRFSSSSYSLEEGLKKFTITRYAIFDVNTNYLGINSFKIIGNFMWNDGSSDGIENLPFNSQVNDYIKVDIKSLAPIYYAVYKTDQSGDISHYEYKYGDKKDIQSTVFFIDGSFEVNYNSGSHFDNNTMASPGVEQIHMCDDFDVYIELTMGDQKKVIKYNFTYINLTTFDVNYGGNQNIIINFQEPQNGIIFVEVNNKRYNLTLDQNKTLNYIIPDVLPVGTYNITVSFIDDEAKIYSFNSTNITVSKVSDYDFNATVTPTVYLGDNATVTLSLPDGATGNVTVKVGDNESKTFNVNETVTIDGFVVGDNVVNVTYNGNDIYDAKSVVKTVVASTKPTALVASDVTAIYNVTKELIITLTSNGDLLANKKINVVVGSINENLTTNGSGQVSIDISSLTPDTYTANIAFAGDELYNKSSTTAKVTVKEEIKTNITVPEITAGKATTTTITLPQNATGNVTVLVDGKEYSVVALTNGSATVTIPELSAGKHNVTISYSGDDNYAGFAQTSSVEVKEPAKPTPKSDDQKPATVKKTATKITAKKKTFKAKKKVKKYTITLKAGKKPVKKVQVILKIGKKTYKAKTNAKGKATFKIKKLTKKGKYNAKITFKGNKLYKASSKKVKITVKK